MIELSVVVVSYEMARELPRTLLSLSPGYQAIDRDRYEIVVVDNGSAAPPRTEDFAGLGADLRVLGCRAPSVSPVRAINEGLAAARGPLVGVWIDGARLASPGLLRACLAAARLHARPVIATPNYQLGPNLQRISAAEGYDRAHEDALLDSIGWPADGRRLFEIATPEQKGGIGAPMLESNALFLKRDDWAALGGYDERFDEPGGGMVNPDTLRRAVELPGAQLIRIDGEATFHQIHGGLSTSSQALAMATVKEGTRVYLRLRGRAPAAIREVGWIFDAASGALRRGGPAG